MWSDWIETRQGITFATSPSLLALPPKKTEWERDRQTDREDHLGNPIDPAKSKSLRKLAGPGGVNGKNSKGGLGGTRRGGIKEEKEEKTRSSSSAATSHYLDKSGIGGVELGRGIFVSERGVGWGVDVGVPVLFPLPSRYRLLRSMSSSSASSSWSFALRCVWEK